jgi:hypothetical protein
MKHGVYYRCSFGDSAGLDCPRCWGRDPNKRSFDDRIPLITKEYVSIIPKSNDLERDLASGP